MCDLHGMLICAVVDQRSYFSLFSSEKYEPFTSSLYISQVLCQSVMLGYIVSLVLKGQI